MSIRYYCQTNTGNKGQTTLYSRDENNKLIPIRVDKTYIKIKLNGLIDKLQADISITYNNAKDELLKVPGMSVNYKKFIIIRLLYFISDDLYKIMGFVSGMNDFPELNYDFKTEKKHNFSYIYSLITKYQIDIHKELENFDNTHDSDTLDYSYKMPLITTFTNYCSLPKINCELNIIRASVREVELVCWEVKQEDCEFEVACIYFNKLSDLFFRLSQLY